MRDSLVKRLIINSTEFSSMIQIGDSIDLRPYTAAVAVQKEDTTYYEDETLDVPELPTHVRKLNVNVMRFNYKPIRVNNIYVNGITGSSILHIGSTHRIDGSSQIRHKRILRK